MTAAKTPREEPAESPGGTASQQPGDWPQQGTQQGRGQDARPVAEWLSPFELLAAQSLNAATGARASNTGCLAMTFAEYLQLLDWNGRQLRQEQRGAIPADLAPILETGDGVQPAVPAIGGHASVTGAGRGEMGPQTPRRNLAKPRRIRRASISGRRRVEPRTRAGHRRGGARGDRACGHCVDRARPRRRRRSLLKRANRIAFGQRFDQHRGARRRPSGSDRPTGRPSWPTGHATATHSRPRNRSVKRGESKAYETWVAPIRHPYTRISKAVDYHGLNFGPPLSESSASSISRPKPPSAYPSTMRSSSALIASCPPYR